MTVEDLVDFSPQHPASVPPLPNATNLILIDNYDSFTWNVYQYLVLEGATVTVFRNDEITLSQLIDLKPTQLVISPGPGHPDTDGGVSKEAIASFAGKIPILGVCMGEQCMYSVFGGRVDVTGEILHGKTSLLRHDGKGVYESLSQNLPVTRYHSLAGTHPTLPECLEVSSWTEIKDSNGNVARGVIMGVRHKEYAIEGVQFHPESILTAEGRVMLKNFLRLRGGKWETNDDHTKNAKPTNAAGSQTNGVNGAGSSQNRQENILETIFEHRKKEVALQKEIPSQRPSDLQAAYDLNLAPPHIPFPQRLRDSPFKLSLMAEIKRASPSKGIIAIDTCAPALAREYAKAGASTISVLTEPEWFKGSIEDLRAVRQALEGMPNRPAILRKEFVFNEYQILEARLAGADTVLLIVKMLDEQHLKRLYEYSQALGMEPLVEVNTIEEMEVASRLNAQVIGVNNRNLVNFEVDLNTTSRLRSAAPLNSIICALSGISGPDDVVQYQQSGVGAVLVGEALMRAQDKASFVERLLERNNEPTAEVKPSKPLIKICGTRTPEAAEAAIVAGADLIGMILVNGRKRTVSLETAKSISKVVHDKIRGQNLSPKHSSNSLACDWFSHTSMNFFSHPNRALVVGVFQDQPLEYILALQKHLDLDIVQLHGSEPPEWTRLIPVPVIRSFKPDDHDASLRSYHALPLLDGGSGGSGQTLPTNEIQTTLKKDKQIRVILAGGLNPENVVEKVKSLGSFQQQIAAVDVSSGVEVDGQQDFARIRAFVDAVKGM